MSEEPRRLLDDPELSELLRDDLHVASKDTDVEFDATSGLERLRAAIGGAPPAPPNPSSAAASGTTKALIFGGIGLGIVAAIAIGLTRPKDTPAVVTSAPAIVTSTPAVAPPSEKPIASAEVSIDDLPNEELTTAPLPSASAPLSPEERLRAEMKQLAEIRSAPPARALQLANEGHQRFKSGIFYQEREALAISALVALGRAGEAKTRARAFLSTFPRGPYAERVRRETGIAAP